MVLSLWDFASGDKNILGFCKVIPLPLVLRLNFRKKAKRQQFINHNFIWLDIGLNGYGFSYYFS